MKLVHAYIQPHKLSDVALALHGLCGMTVIDAQGRGRGKEQAERSDRIERVSDFEPHTRIEVCCADAATDEIIEAIRQAAHTGLRGDGLIFTTGVEEAVRIGTGERGDHAC